LEFRENAFDFQTSQQNLIQEKAEEDELRVQEKYHKEVLDRLIDTLIENNHLMDKVATHFGIEID
jgi:hypothetical protein